MKVKDIIGKRVSDFLMLEESAVPNYVTYALEKVIENKKITAIAELSVIANLIQMFQSGPVPYWPAEVLGWKNYAPASLIDMVRELSSEEIVEVSSWLYNQLKNIENAEFKKFSDMTMDSKAFLKKHILTEK